MITTSEATRQIVRLSVLRYRPEQMDEIVAAFQTYAQSRDHATRMTDWLLRRYTDFPVPVEIAEAAEATREGEGRVKPDRRCRGCDGTGYEQVWQLVTYHKTEGGGCYKSLDAITSPETAAELRKLCDGKNQILYDCVRPCTHCRYGAAIATPREEAPAKKPAGLQKIDMRKHAAGDED